MLKVLLAACRWPPELTWIEAPLPVRVAKVSPVAVMVPLTTIWDAP